MNALEGKGWFVWRVASAEGGNADTISALLAEGGYSHAHIKIANGIYSYNITDKGVDKAKELVDALHARGLKAWGWHYVYGDSPSAEADIAIARIRATGVDGYAIDAEAEYKVSGKDAAARMFMSRLRAAFPTLSIALCSYRFPTLHLQLPWDAFLEHCDYHMPQMYWVGAHNPVEQLLRSATELMFRKPIPIMPVGSAYVSGTWQSTTDDVKAFMNAARSMEMRAASFWELAHTRARLPAIYNTISAYEWPFEQDGEMDAYDDLVACKDELIVLNDSLQGVLVKMNDALVRLADELPIPQPPEPPDPEPPSPPPLPDNVYDFKITEAPRANAFYFRRVDKEIKPIMEIYENSESNRVQCPVGQTCWKVFKNAVPASGGVKYFQIYNVMGEAGEKLFVKKDSGDIKI